jgi:hypothetical protein
VTILDGVFWSRPPEDDDSRPADPLGLDAMREELSDHLVRCLTGRTWSHEEFFWSLVFLRWAEEEERTDEARVRRFLHWERCLKLHWAHRRPEGFPGVNRARIQAAERGAPSARFRPLLKNQRTQGMLGAHLEPLRKLALVSGAAVALTDDGRSLVAGAGSVPELKDGDWSSWTRVFVRAERGFDGFFRRRLRERLASKMPELHAALAAVRWRQSASWKQAAKHIGAPLRPFALLADEFCPWADSLRVLFHDLVRSSPRDPAPVLPPPISRPIPRGLVRWKPLRQALRRWRRREGDRVLADLHQRVFSERGYEHDVWIRWEDSRRLTYPGRASSGVAQEGSDCRWSNAVRLMRPGR